MSKENPNSRGLTSPSHLARRYAQRKLEGTDMPTPLEISLFEAMQAAFLAGYRAGRKGEGQEYSAERVHGMKLRADHKACRTAYLLHQGGTADTDIARHFGVTSVTARLMREAHSGRMRIGRK